VGSGQSALGMGDKVPAAGAHPARRTLFVGPTGVSAVVDSLGPRMT
jgi:hypothetical protein